MFSSLQPHGPAACQATLSITNFQSLLKLMSTKLAAAAAKSLQSCLTLCDPRDGNPPGSPVPGILLARTLEWVAIFLQGIFPTLEPVSLTLQALSLLSEPPGKQNRKDGKKIIKPRNEISKGTPNELI